MQTQDPTDKKWYSGTVEAVYTSGAAKVVYDDGESYTWTPAADAPAVLNANFDNIVGQQAPQVIYILPPEHPAFTNKVLEGAPTQSLIIPEVA